MQMHCLSKCKWPESKVDGLLPSTFRVRQLLLCLVLDVIYGSLSNAILEVGINAAVADVLSVGLAMVNKGVVCKPAIVSMVLLDFNAMMRC